MAVEVKVINNTGETTDRYEAAVSWVVSEGRLTLYGNDNKKLAEYNNGTWTKVVTD